MATTWNAIYLGPPNFPQIQPTLDPAEGNTVAEGYANFVGLTFGTQSSPLFLRVQSLTAVDNGGHSGLLDQDNDVAGDQFTTDLNRDGFPETHTFDAVARYNATVTFQDGSTAAVEVELFQDTEGQTFLAPPRSDQPELQETLSSGAIVSLTIDSVAPGGEEAEGLEIDRQGITFADGVVEGTDGDDLIDADYAGDVDRVDNNDATPWYGVPGSNDDLIFAGPGSDTVRAGEGNDIVFGEDGDDFLHGGPGDDTLIGDEGDDHLQGDEGSDVLFGGAGRDVFLIGNNPTANDYDLILDFNAGSDLSQRDTVVLSEYYNQTNLDLWNAANPEQQFAHPLAWLRADQEDGMLDMLDGQNGLPGMRLMIHNNGSPVAPTDLVSDNTHVPCFSADALIETDRGPVPAGELAVGDMVRTRDAGFQPVRWAGRRALSAAELAAAPNLRPIRIAAGALGANTPSADLIVSPQHRVLVRSRIAQKMFGTDEVLVAAKQLLLIDGIDIVDGPEGVTYVHILFDDHQVVWSNGAETESLHPGRQALNAVGTASREEIFAIFPELRDAAAERTPARPLASGRMARKLAMRHLQNGRPLVA